MLCFFAFLNPFIPGLPPDEIKRYDPRSFLIQIMIKTGVIAQMQCNMNRDGVYQLAEIRFCFDDSWELADCPSHNQPTYPMNKNGTKKYNPQGKTLHRPQPSFHIGICGGKGQILFPGVIPASPPPPRHPRQHPPPPPPPKSSPRKPEFPQPPLPPPPAPPKNPLIPSPPTPRVLSFAAMLRKGMQSPPPSPPPPRHPGQHPPPPPPPRRPKSSPLKPEHQPPLPPPPKNPLILSPPTSRVLSFAAVLCKGVPPSPASAAQTRNAKSCRAWRHFSKLILTLQKFLFYVGVVGTLRTLRGTAKTSRKKNVRWMTFFYFFRCFGPLKMKRA